MELKYLFSPRKIGNIQIKNRIVRSATGNKWEYVASKKGYIKDQLIKLYTDLAQGGTGLIITGAIAVELGNKSGSSMASIQDDSFISGQKKLVDAVHEFSDVKIAAQLNHAGYLGNLRKYPPVAPSPITSKITKRVARELKNEEIKEIIKRFVNAGQKTYESGYDMVQIHASHATLLSTFISPYFNKRTDEFGGNTQKRIKILIDTYNQLRDEVGKKFPIIIKLQTQDFVLGGLTLEEGKLITKIIVDIGYDAIEPSGGLAELIITDPDKSPCKRIKSPDDENYFLPAAKDLHPIMNDCPLILVGGIKNPLSAERILQENIADFISMCRPLIREPDLPNRWKNGDISPALCISCNSCLMSFMTGSLHCVVKKKIEKRRRRDKNLKI